MSDSDKSTTSFSAILSMDGYNRGYDQQVFGLSDAPGTQNRHRHGQYGLNGKMRGFAVPAKITRKRWFVKVRFHPDRATRRRLWSMLDIWRSSWWVRQPRSTLVTLCMPDHSSRVIHHDGAPTAQRPILGRECLEKGGPRRPVPIDRDIKTAIARGPPARLSAFRPIQGDDEVIPTAIKNDRRYESLFSAPPPLCFPWGNPARDTSRQHRWNIWTWAAIDADTKLVPSWLVGSRDAHAAHAFIGDLALRLSNRVQLTSDGHKPYLAAVEESFGADIDYAMLIKHYGEPVGATGRYSPGECIGIEQRRVEGRPDPARVSTSFAERQNLSMPTGMRRFTRPTNAFSKKAENHAHSVAIYFMHYNFVRIHQTLRCTPAMAAGVTTKLWELSDMVRVLEDWEAGRDAT
jgi:IS1 family transposase